MAQTRREAIRHRPARRAAVVVHERTCQSARDPRGLESSNDCTLHGVCKCFHNSPPFSHFSSRARVSKPSNLKPQFLDVVVFSSLVYFCPTIVNGLGYTSIHAQLMTVPAWSIGFVVSLIVAYSGDKFNARGYHAALTATLGGIGFLACVILPAHAYRARYGCLLLASCGAFPTLAPLAGWVTCNAPGQRTVGLCAALNSAGVGLASVVSVWIWRAQEAPRGFPTGNIVCAVCSFVSALLAIGLRLHYGRLNKKTAASGDLNARVWVY